MDFSTGLIWGLVLGLNPIGYISNYFRDLCGGSSLFSEVSHLINQLL